MLHLTGRFGCPATFQSLRSRLDRANDTGVTLSGRVQNPAGCAEQLVMSKTTADPRRRAMVKLAARDRAPPVVVAYPTGLVGHGAAPAGLTSRGRRGPRQSTGTVR